ncbi:MAG: hypothetical protein ACI3U1_03900, partial [Peptococcaceae bacterium]
GQHRNNMVNNTVITDFFMGYTPFDGLRTGWSFLYQIACNRKAARSGRQPEYIYYTVGVFILQV